MITDIETVFAFLASTHFAAGVVLFCIAIPAVFLLDWFKDRGDR